MKTKFSFLIICLLICACLAVQAQENPATYVIISKGLEIGTVELSVADQGQGVSITSDTEFTRDGTTRDYTAILDLDAASSPQSYRMIIDGSQGRARLTCQFGDSRVEISFAGQSWSLEPPEQGWTLLDTNSLIGFYLFSLQADPAMNTRRGTALLLPVRQFSPYELRSNGPAVLVIEEQTVQCDSYMLTIDGRVSYQLYVRGDELIAVNQQDTELSIRLRME